MPKRLVLYQDAAKRMAISPDACIERIRHCCINSKFGDESVDPASLATIAEMHDDWGATAVAELRSTGFINTDWSRFKWYQPCGKELDDKIAELAAIEAATVCFLKKSGLARALVRSKSVAFAQFSQNSNAAGVGGLIHAHDVQAVPSGLLRWASVSSAPGPAACDNSIDAMPLNEPQPPAGSGTSIATASSVGVIRDVMPKCSLKQRTRGGCLQRGGAVVSLKAILSRDK